MGAKNPNLSCFCRFHSINILVFSCLPAWTKQKICQSCLRYHRSLSSLPEKVESEFKINSHAKMTPTASRTLSSVLTASSEPCLPPSTRKDWIPVNEFEKINIKIKKTFVAKAMAYPSPFLPEPSQALVLSLTPELWGFNYQLKRNNPPRVKKLPPGEKNAYL